MRSLAGLLKFLPEGKKKVAEKVKYLARMLPNPFPGMFGLPQYLREGLAMMTPRA